MFQNLVKLISMPVIKITIQTNFSEERQYCTDQQCFKIFLITRVFKFKAKAIIETLTRSKKMISETMCEKENKIRI